MSERKSEVMVAVLDFTEIEGKAAVAYAEAHSELSNVSAKVNHKWGIVETPRGIFMICDEGVMSIHPLSKEHPTTIQISMEYEREGKEIIDLLPAYTLNVTDEAIPEIPVVEEVNLSDFIRRFGSRLECNFYECNAALSKELGLEVLA